MLRMTTPGCLGGFRHPLRVAWTTRRIQDFGPLRAFAVAALHLVHTLPDIESTNRKLIIVSLALILFAGVFLRLPPALFDDSEPLHSLAVLHPNPKWHNMRLIGV